MLTAQLFSLQAQAGGLNERPRLGVMHKVLTAATIAYMTLAGAMHLDAREPLAKAYAFGADEAAHFKADASTFTKNPFAASLWGGIHAALRSVPKSQSIYVHDTAVSSPKGLKLESWLVPPALFGDHKHPIVFILPGTFATGLSATSVAVEELFIRRGFHVISIPSPLSLEYIKAGVRTQPLDIPAEADVTLRLIRAALDSINPNRISSYHLEGNSYGGFLAGVVAAKDSMSAHPIFTEESSSVTAVSPPLHFGRAIGALDGYLKDTQEAWDRDYADSMPVKAGLNIVFSGRPESLDPRVLVDAKAIFAHTGFKTPAGRSVKAYADQWGLKNVYPTDSAELAKWRQNLRLRPALSTISPRGSDFLDDATRSDLGYWLSQLKGRSKATVQIEASIDDPLNRPSDWTTNRFYNLAQHAALSPHGGHFGAVPTREFRALLGSGIPPTKTAPPVTTASRSQRQ